MELTNITFDEINGELNISNTIVINKDTTVQMFIDSIENVRHDLEIQKQWLEDNIHQLPSVISIGEGLESKRINYSFSWGDITSSYDSRSAYSSIFIKYNRC